MFLLPLLDGGFGERAEVARDEIGGEVGILGVEESLELLHVVAAHAA